MLIKCAQYKLTTKQVPSVHWIIFWVSTDDNVAAYCIYSVVTDNKTLVHIDCPQILHWICKRYWCLWFIIGCTFLAKIFLVPHPPSIKQIKHILPQTECLLQSPAKICAVSYCICLCTLIDNFYFVEFCFLFFQKVWSHCTQACLDSEYTLCNLEFYVAYFD